MGKLISPLSERKVAMLARQEGFHAVGGINGLYLSVLGGGRSWILRYMHQNRRRNLGLGSYTDLTLLEAREEARLQRKLLRSGIDPIAAKRTQRDQQRVASAKRMTFRECAMGYLDAHSDGWRNAKHALQVERALENHAGKILGDLDVSVIDTPLVMKVIQPLWKEKTETASRLRMRIENILSWAKVQGLRAGENPARWRGHLDQLLAKPSKVKKVEHFASLPYIQIGAFCEALSGQEGVAARAVELVILTAARSGEVRGARWDEFDLDAGVWTIPAERMKANREHLVPLSDAARSIIKAMQKTRLNDFVFPGTKDDKPLSDMSLTAVLRRMERRDLTVHGFRSTFRDWASEVSSYPAEMAEMALAHTIGNKTEAAYRRGNLLAKRFKMMADWSKWCAQPQTKASVVPLRKKSATA
jgi:integrase